MLANHGLAPEKFMKMDATAKEYYFSEMSNEFFELHLCSDVWKLELWSSKNYSSWAQNHLDSKKENAKHCKLEKDVKAKELASITSANLSNDSSHQHTAPPGTLSNDSPTSQAPFGSGLLPNDPRPSPSLNVSDQAFSGLHTSNGSPDKTGSQAPGPSSLNNPPYPPPSSGKAHRQPSFEDDG